MWYIHELKHITTSANITRSMSVAIKNPADYLKSKENMLSNAQIKKNQESNAIHAVKRASTGGPSKPMGFTKISPKFISLTVSLF